MIDQTQLSNIKTYLDQARSVIIVFQKDATIDHQATSVALARGLRAVGKEVLLATPVLQKNSPISGIEQATTEIGNQNLLISFEYNETAVDKVSYHIGEETGRFYLTIKPKKGAAPLDSSTVEFSHTGVEADVLILVGVTSFEELEQLYYGYEDFYQNTPTIALSSQATGLGHVSVTTGSFSSSSEYIVQLFGALQLPIDADAATNLLMAIEEQTNALASAKATADTFDAVAQLLRLGAQRKQHQKPSAEKQEVTIVEKKPLPAKPPTKKLKAKQEKAGSLSYQPSGTAPKGG